MRKESDILCIYLWTGRELAQVEEKSLGIGYKRLPKLKVELVVWPLPPPSPLSLWSAGEINFFLFHTERNHAT